MRAPLVRLALAGLLYLIGDLDQHRRHLAQALGWAVAADNATAVRRDRQDDVVDFLEAVSRQAPAQRPIGKGQGLLDHRSWILCHAGILAR